MSCLAECPNRRPHVAGVETLSAGLHVCDGVTHALNRLKHHCAGCGAVWFEDPSAQARWKNRR